MAFTFHSLYCRHESSDTVQVPQIHKNNQRVLSNSAQVCTTPAQYLHNTCTTSAKSLKTEFLPVSLQADKPLSCTSCGSCTFNSWAKKVKGAVVFGQASGNVACLSQCVSYGADGKCAAYSSCSSTGIASGPAGSTVQTGSVTTQVQTQGDAGGNALGAIGQNNGASVQGGALIGSNVPSGFFNMFNQATPAPVAQHTPTPAQWG